MTGAARFDPADDSVQKRPRFLVTSVTLAVALATTCVAWQLHWLGAWFGPNSRSSERPLGVQSPYLNARPGVQYVGDTACARCHADITKTYHNHPMGRSLSQTSAAPRVASFQSKGLEFAVEKRGDRVVHKETKRDAHGQVVSQNEAEVRYVIGSGEQALAFLVERGDGYLFESPITWYSKKQKWDLSPGYEQENLHFERFVKPACLFCHSNSFHHVQGTENHYKEPIFDGLSIGCERCHGPGELHVKKPELDRDERPNIVNPAMLEPVLRESVCQQCHLQGDIRIVRPGRKLTDFRPGLPLSSVESVFVKAANAGNTRFFGQVEQMHASRCFRDSQGQMGCISCHDPHQLPDPLEKVPYYRDRCLECHANKGCSLPVAARHARGRDDDCIACHMPRSANEQVPHVATTLHLIPRFADGTREPEAPPATTANPSLPIVHFHRDSISPAEQKGVSRDLGIALATRSGAIPGWTPKAQSRLALPMLNAALEADPADAPSWSAKGIALWLSGRSQESLTALQTALAKTPDHEQTIVATAIRAAQMGRAQRQQALDLINRAIAINPYRADYHHVAALLHSQRQEWPQALDASTKSLQLNPFNHEARMLLVQCLIKQKDLTRARTEFQTLLENDPPDRAALEQWFAKNVPRE